MRLFPKMTCTLLSVVLLIAVKPSVGDSWLNEAGNGFVEGVSEIRKDLHVLNFAFPADSRTKTEVHLVDRNGRIVRMPVVARAAAEKATSSSSANIALLAWSNQPVPGGGTLKIIDGLSQPNINNKMQIAFYSAIDGAQTNQGIFIADAEGLHSIALGCSDGGGGINPGPPGCGTPSPVGGTFRGFFGGTVDTPDINDQGDVLFPADIRGGSRPRGLFLYQASTQQIVKIAAVGDSSPFGGKLRTIGAGSLNNNGDIVFIATTSVSALENQQILLWKHGSLLGVARAGDVAPGGGAFTNLTPWASGFKDGTERPDCAPDINDRGDISFWALIERDGGYHQGLIVSQLGVLKWYAQEGQPTPVGGKYLAFLNPTLNNTGQIAFYAEIRDAAGNVQVGWFAGKAGQWRKVFLSNDVIKESGTIIELASSVNPIDSLDDSGNVLFWIRVRYPDRAMRDYLMVSKPDQHRLIVLAERMASPIGPISRINPWESLNSNRYATATSRSVHMIFQAIKP